jgi:hypothetical protein
MSMLSKLDFYGVNPLEQDEPRRGCVSKHQRGCALEKVCQKFSRQNLLEVCVGNPYYGGRLSAVDLLVKLV